MQADVEGPRLVFVKMALHLLQILPEDPKCGRLLLRVELVEKVPVVKYLKCLHFVVVEPLVVFYCAPEFWWRRLCTALTHLHVPDPLRAARGVEEGVVLPHVEDDGLLTLPPCAFSSRTLLRPPLEDLDVSVQDVNGAA